MAIGVEGGFQFQDVENEENSQINEVRQTLYFVAIDFENKNSVQRMILPENSLPEKVIMSITGIVKAESVAKKQVLQAWEGEVAQVSKFAENLSQISPAPKISMNPEDWQCEKCGMKKNLWLNLSSGAILCGRKQSDGSGGNNHAIEHYDTNKNCPLAVKLGTVTADGNADVYSYPEDSLAIDPHLEKHLAWFGLDLKKLEKTDKTIAELEIDQTLKMDFSAITEEGKKLERVYGKGFTGLQNLGNTCYMNSVLQCVFSIPEFIQHFYLGKEKNENVLESTITQKLIKEKQKYQPDLDFETQLLKVADGLLSGRYSVKRITQLLDEKDELMEKEVDQEGIAPRDFKAVIGKDHPEFSTNQQQDAAEFFTYLLDTITSECSSSNETVNLFNFELDGSIKCSESQQSLPKVEQKSILEIPVPLEKAKNRKEYDNYLKDKEERDKKQKQLAQEGKIVLEKDFEVVRPQVSINDCFKTLMENEVIEDFFSPFILAKTIGIKTNRLRNFPKYLAVRINRFTFDEAWKPIKLNCSLLDTEKIDISYLKAAGTTSTSGAGASSFSLPAGLEDLLTMEPRKKKKKYDIDELTLETLIDISGFSKGQCEKAIVSTKNIGPDAAMNWLLEHPDDPGFSQTEINAIEKGDEEFGEPQPTKDEAEMQLNPQDIDNLMSMGFDRERTVFALKKNNKNVEAALDFLFANPEEEVFKMIQTDKEKQEKKKAAAGKKAEFFNSANGEYELFATISHIGNNTGCGHYVCHIKKEGNWYVYNDRKVALSAAPPLDMGYIYLYKNLEK